MDYFSVIIVLGSQIIAVLIYKSIISNTQYWITGKQTERFLYAIRSMAFGNRRNGNNNNDNRTTNGPSTNPTQAK